MEEARQDQGEARRNAGDGGWNGPEVLALVERGRAARRVLSGDGGLESYRALTEGHIYFFVDPEQGDRSLIRVDQVAVELRWQAPGEVHQHVVGERSETRLPVRDFRYYLDRLTLVQYGFGDEIQVGSGLDVAGVPHPLARDAGPSGAERYDFRITDSLTLRLPGGTEPVRLTEVQVRPQDAELPGILGTLLLDRASGQIVRMAFTFTPASYVDPRTDRIEVEVDYGLWEGRYWLPNQQVIDVRRELPELDLGVGTVIRAVLTVGGYELNVPFADDLRLVPPVTWDPGEERAAYAFREGLLDELDRHGLEALDTRPDEAELRREAVELIGRRPPSGLAPLRPHLAGISSAVRYNRAEGAFLGSGGSFRPTPDTRLRLRGGYAFGTGHASGVADVEGEVGSRGLWRLRAEANEIGDLGLVPGADPLLSSLGAMIRAEDYLDPFRSSGLRGAIRFDPEGPWILSAVAGIRRDRSLRRAERTAPFDGSREFRPVRPIEEADFALLDLEAERSLAWPGGGRGSTIATLAALVGTAGSGLEVRLDARARWADPTGSQEIESRVLARRWFGDPLPQAHRLLGGRGSVPGYPFRRWAGRDLVLASAEAAVDVHGPLVRLRAGLHAGWAERAEPGVAEAWDAGGTGGVRPAATLGLGLGWDVLRVEAARGLRDGEWQLLLSVDPRWWPYL